jgi:hypothetical protein
MPSDKQPRAPVEVDVSAAAAALGRIKTPKKAASSARNAKKARAAVPLEKLRENARKATAASAAKSALMTPEERSARARNAVLARWKKAKKST